MENYQTSVGQLAKVPFPTLKPIKNNGFGVGRLVKKQARTHTRRREEAQIFDFKGFKELSFLIEQLFSDIKICYHNLELIKQIQQQYSEQESELFLQYVRVFSLLRRSDKPQPIKNIIFTDQDDFLSAFRLMKQRNIEEYHNIKLSTKNGVLAELQKSFSYRTFSAKILSRETKYAKQTLDRVLTILHFERKIEFFEVVGSHTMYRLPTTTVKYA